MPSPGHITHLRAASGPGVRDDGGLTAPGEVPIYYDPLVAKLIAWGGDRPQSIARLARALREYEIEGIKTTIPFFRWLLTNEDYLAARVDTTWLDRVLATRAGEPFWASDEPVADLASIAAAIQACTARGAASAQPGRRAGRDWRLGGGSTPRGTSMRPSAFELEVDGLVRKVQVAHERGRFEILLDGVAHSVDAVAIEPGRWSLLMADGRSHEVVIVTNGHEGAATVLVDGSTVPIGVRDPRRRRDAAGGHAARWSGPHRRARCQGRSYASSPRRVMPVSARQSVIVVEAMKMENELRAPRAGIVGEVLVREGALVDAGTLLLTIG